MGREPVAVSLVRDSQADTLPLRPRIALSIREFLINICCTIEDSYDHMITKYYNRLLLPIQKPLYVFRVNNNNFRLFQADIFSI